MATTSTQNDADIDAMNEICDTPLHCINCTKNPKVVLSLIKNGADVNARNVYGKTPLHCTTNSESALLLIEYGADINIQNYSGKTPLDTNCSLICWWFRRLERHANLLAADQIKFAQILVRNGAVVTKYVRDEMPTSLTNMLLEERVKYLFLKAWHKRRFCIWRKMAAKRTICRAIIRAMTNSEYAMCRRRLVSEFENLLQ